MKTYFLLAAIIGLSGLVAGCSISDITIQSDADISETLADDQGRGVMMIDEVNNSITEDQMVDQLDEPTANEAKVFNISGTNFAFSQTEITVKKGDRVVINFTSTDGFHDWVVDEFGAATKQVMTGDSSSVEFIADQAGTFEYYCSVGQHRQMGMIGKLIVE
ncbi:MAG: cupredoxin domain-containing protein [Patescibacteria group bacterium]|jgi:plastocyanin|nr:cupredoxin domain-containing protein [Patescibacteria group bacterium]